MYKYNLEKRCSKRISIKEYGTVCLNKETLKVWILNISAKGALIKFINRVSFPKNEIFNLSIKPYDSFIHLNFVCEMVHCCDELTGVKFVPITA